MIQEKSNSHNFDPKKLNLLDFSIISESIVQPEYFDEETITEYDSKIGVAIAFNVQDELIRLEYNIDLQTFSSNKAEAKAAFSFVFIFGYLSYEDVVKTIDKRLKASAQLGRAIFAVSHSTIRGILFMKLSNTVMHDFILPISDTSMENFMKEASKRKQN